MKKIKQNNIIAYNKSILMALEEEFHSLRLI